MPASFALCVELTDAIFLFIFIGIFGEKAYLRALRHWMQLRCASW
jgi:hypothetical protein